jgi:hypothetical protein
MIVLRLNPIWSFLPASFVAWLSPDRQTAEANAKRGDAARRVGQSGPGAAKPAVRSGYNCPESGERAKLAAGPMTGPGRRRREP